MTPLWIALPLALLLGGCSHMPVTSMLALSRVDFSQTDPAQLRAAVKLPRALRTRGAAMRLTVKLRSGQEEALDVALREVSDPRELLAMHAELDRGTHLFAYRIDDADLPRLRTFRDALLVKQQGRSGGALTIAIRPDACRAGALPGGPVHLTTYLRTGETRRYVPLARDVDLRTLDASKDVIQAMPTCG